MHEIADKQDEERQTQAEKELEDL
jgi:ATP-binding cassette, subfamily B (MDR/TAP), member 1